MQQSLKWGMAVPDSQQPLPQTITVPEVQKRSSVKRIHQRRRLVAKSASRDVMANTPTDESRSRISILQTRMRSRHSFGNPAIHGCYELVVGGATTYIRGITVQKSKTTSTASKYHTGSAGRKHHGGHLLAEIHSWRLVDEIWMPRQVTARHTWRRSGKHARRKLGERTRQLEIISAPSTGRMSRVPTSAPTSRRMISATARTPESWWEDHWSLIYAERVQLCQLKLYPMRPKMISECTE